MFAATATAVLLGVHSAAAPSPPPAGAEEEAAREACAVPVIAAALRESPRWRDLQSPLGRDGALVEALEAQMPGYRLAFRHRASAGLLLVGVERMDSAEAGSAAFWAETAEAAARACAESGADCQVETFEQVPHGLRATTRFAAESSAMRRETLAFSDSRDCGYSIQFTGANARFDEAGWVAVRKALLELRGLLAPARQSRRQRGGDPESSRPDPAFEFRLR